MPSLPRLEPGAQTASAHTVVTGRDDDMLIWNAQGGTELGLDKMLTDCLKRSDVLSEIVSMPEVSVVLGSRDRAGCSTRSIAPL